MFGKGAGDRKEQITGLLTRHPFPPDAVGRSPWKLYVRVGVSFCVRPFQNMDLRCKGAAALKLFTEAASSRRPDVD